MVTAEMTRAPCLVMWSRRQARRFIAQRPDVRQVLSLTPAVRVELLGIDVPVVSSSEIFDGPGHLRGLARIIRAERHAKKCLSREMMIAPEIHDHVIDSIIGVASLASAVWEMLKGRGPWLVCADDGFEPADDMETAHRLVLKGLQRVSGPGGKPVFTALFRVLLGLCNRLLARRLKAARTVVVSGFTRGMKPLIEELGERDRGLRFLRISTCHATRSHVVNALGQLFSTSRNQIHIQIDGHAAQDLRGALKAVFASLQDRPTRNGVEALSGHILDSVEAADIYSRGAQAIITTVKPEAVLLWEAGSLKGTAIIRSAKLTGASVLIAAHAPITPPDSSITRHYRNRWGRQMTASPDANLIFVQSPVARDFARSLDNGRRLQPVQSFMYCFQARPSGAAQSDPPMILYASNYFGWSSHTPWLQETADEMVDSMAEVVRAVSGMAAVSLLIRAKANWRNSLIKGECNADDLQILLPEAGNCRITDTGSFNDDLFRSTLVICFAASTIEEALLARRPVLLWGGRQRYRYIQARDAAPLPDDRAAVYMPPEGGDLASFIGLVVAAHAGRPLTDEEVAPYVWGGTVPGRELVADMIVNGSYP